MFLVSGFVKVQLDLEFARSLLFGCVFVQISISKLCMIYFVSVHICALANDRDYKYVKILRTFCFASMNVDRINHL